MNKKDGGPAFSNGVSDSSSGACHIIDGMTLRDYFAINASEKDIFVQKLLGSNIGVLVSREEAKYKYADAMLKEREK